MKNNLSRVGRYRDLRDIRRYGGAFDLNELDEAFPPDPDSGYPELPIELQYHNQRVEGLYNALKPVRCERFINSQTYMGSTSDYDGAYDVTEMFFSATPGNYKLYLGQHNTVNPSFYNDWTVGAIQILDLAGNVLHSFKCNSTENKFDTTTTHISRTTFNNPISDSSISGLTYAGVSSGFNFSRWTYASSTSSSYTGARNGISVENLDNVPMTVGQETMPQRPTIVSSQYLYRETTSSSLDTCVLARTKDTYAIPAYGSIRIAYTLCIPTAEQTDIDPEDCLFLGFY